MKNYKNTWKLLANTKSITALNTIQYQILRAMTARNSNQLDPKDLAILFLERAFTPVTNRVKLRNGRRPYDIIHRYNGYTEHLLGFTAWYSESDKVLLQSLETDEEKKLFWSIFKEVTKHNLYKRPKKTCYLWINKELENIQYAVQAGHVALTLGKEHSENFDTRTTHFVLFGTDDILSVKALLDSSNIFNVAFLDEDVLPGKITAIATEPLGYPARKRFSDYQLLTME